MYEPFISRMHQYKKIFNTENYGVICYNSYYDTVKTIEKHKSEFSNVELVMGGNYKIKNTFYIEPTIFKQTIQTTKSELEEKELFAPVLLVKTYNPNKINTAIEDYIEN